MYLTLQNVSCPILMVHARDDPVIPFAHSKTLSDQLLGPVLLGSEAEGRQKLVQEESIGRWGTVKRFTRDGKDGEEGKGRVVWAEVSSQCFLCTPDLEGTRELKQRRRSKGGKPQLD